jgi:hypothetical protein
MDAVLAQHLSLVSIHLQSCGQERGPGDGSDPNQSLESQGGMGLLEDVPEDRMGFGFTLDYTVRDSAREIVLQGQAMYVVMYQRDEETAATLEQVEAYARHGALFQVYPFLREHVATMSQRAGLPTAVLPVLLHDPQEEPD